jgi:AcrR family transcriptional regulator
MLSNKGTAIRERLISAAGPVFARNGYDAARVTEICSAAGANLAAINYHFGDKRSLYREVIKTAIQWLKGDKQGPAWAENRKLSPEQRIAFVSANILRGVLAMDEGNWPLALMLREFLQPTTEFGMIIRAGIDALAPSNPIVQSVSDVTGFATDDSRLQWSMFCVLAPALLLALKPTEMARQFPALEMNKLDLDAFAALIGRILVNGLASAGSTPSRKVKDSV